jgi:hypothetical protein
MKTHRILAAAVAIPTLFVAGCSLLPVSPTPLTTPTSVATATPAPTLVPPTVTFGPPSSATPTPVPLVECDNLRTQTGTFCSGDEPASVDWQGWTWTEPIPAGLTTVVVCSSWPPPAGSQPCEGVVLSSPLSGSSPPEAPLLIPLSPAAAPTAVTWTAADCSWAATTLAQDANLDSAEAAALQAGTDTRYPLSDVAYYEQEASHWTTLAAWIATACTSTTAPPAGEIAQGESWLEAAYQSHVADATVNPQDAAWDAQWEGAYQTLELMLEPDCADGAACAAVS